MKIAFIIFVAYMLLLFDLTIAYSLNNKQTIVRYNGLLWCCLDRWTIWRYESKDIPIKWIEVINK